MADVAFTDREEFEQWLEGKPREWAQVLALRSALRVAPLAMLEIASQERTAYQRLKGSVARCLWLAWGTTKCAVSGTLWHPLALLDAYDALDGAADEFEVAEAAVDYINRTADADRASFRSAAFAAGCAIYSAATKDDAVATANAAYAATYAADAANATVARPGDLWDALSIDAGRLEDVGDPERLLGERLWQDSAEWIEGMWVRAKADLMQSQPHGTFSAWFDRRILGRRDGYPFREGGEVEFFERLIAFDNAWWNRGPTAVDADIAEWLQELAPQTHEPDPQDHNAPVFGISETGKIGIDRLRGSEVLLKDAAAQRRHAKGKERIEKLRNAFRGNNNADAFAPIGDRIDESLGNSLDETEPQMLVLETQSLRDALEIQQEYGPSDDRDPLQGDALRIARDAVNALNLLIGSDPFLEAIDTKLLGPDAVQPLPEPGDIVALADVVRKADLTDADADHALRQAARNAPVPSDPGNRKTGFVVRLGLNLVRWTIDLVVHHESEILAAAVGGTGVGVLTAGIVATGGTALGGLGLAWLLAKNVKQNEEQWRKIAASAKVTSQNFDLLMEKLNKLPLGS